MYFSLSSNITYFDRVTRPFWWKFADIAAAAAAIAGDTICWWFWGGGGGASRCFAGASLSTRSCLTLTWGCCESIDAGIRLFRYSLPFSVDVVAPALDAILPWSARCFITSSLRNTSEGWLGLLVLLISTSGRSLYEDEEYADLPPPKTRKYY